ncbi:hypothetical protein BA195_06720 [Tenacibaculum soleae]|uniref:Uncharacterized protein n=1 Tax=Tenacibaculum soleae TaxID=447689 RepID=A0A1B9Y3H3_9FLAO|nr:hypothetical protein [Tenacibaculum soleae]OCK44364.1 hypothetical protein BA195_06720 [Tenacibaculum soleae]
MAGKKFINEQEYSRPLKAKSCGYTLLGDVWVKPDKPLNELPEGTKAKALGGGYWIKNKRGWKWCTGATFPNVGGDWDGTVLLPK